MFLGSYSHRRCPHLCRDAKPPNILLTIHPLPIPERAHPKPLVQILDNLAPAHVAIVQIPKASGSFARRAPTESPLRLTHLLAVVADRRDRDPAPDRREVETLRDRLVGPAPRHLPLGPLVAQPRGGAPEYLRLPRAPQHHAATVPALNERRVEGAGVLDPVREEQHLLPLVHLALGDLQRELVARLVRHHLLQ